jgi:hypothetical protein
VGARTDAARAEVLAARDELGVEVGRLAASARAAADIPAQVRRAPGRAAALAGGAAFFALGGPRRIVRGARRALFGAPSSLPGSMLPEEIEKVLRSLGTDGDAVRGTVEREFARYLEKTSRSRAERNVKDAASEAAAHLIRTGSRIAGRRLLSRLLSDD